jgi:hypothetical protein
LGWVGLSDGTRVSTCIGTSHKYHLGSVVVAGESGPQPPRIEPCIRRYSTVYSTVQDEGQRYKACLPRNKILGSLTRIAWYV